jgi:DNA-binding GntR family transcriptional regulator
VFQPEDLARAKELIQAMGQERDPVAWLALNREFHDQLYRPSGRLRIRRFANNLRNLIDRYLRMRLGVLQHYEIAQREHRNILAAYRRGNAALAVKRVEAHLQRTADSVVAFLAARMK